MVVKMKYKIVDLTDGKEAVVDDREALFESFLPYPEESPEDWKRLNNAESIDEINEALTVTLLNQGKYTVQEVPEELDILAEARKAATGRHPEACYKEAERMLADGTTVYDLQECREYITGTLFPDEDERKGAFWQSYVDMLEKNIPARDWDVVTKWGKPYFVAYCC